MSQFSLSRILPPLLLFALGMLSARWLFPEPPATPDPATQTLEP